MRFASRFLARGADEASDTVNPRVSVIWFPPGNYFITRLFGQLSCFNSLREDGGGCSGFQLAPCLGSFSIRGAGGGGSWGYLGIEQEFHKGSSGGNIWGQYGCSMGMAVASPCVSFRHVFASEQGQHSGMTTS